MGCKWFFVERVLMWKVAQTLERDRGFEPLTFSLGISWFPVFMSYHMIRHTVENTLHWAILLRQNESLTVALYYPISPCIFVKVASWLSEPPTVRPLPKRESPHVAKRGALFL